VHDTARCRGSLPGTHPPWARVVSTSTRHACHPMGIDQKPIVNAPAR
jgi:hypothetical protein